MGLFSEEYVSLSQRFEIRRTANKKNKFVFFCSDIYHSFIFFLRVTEYKFHHWLFVRDKGCKHCCLFCKHYFECEMEMEDMKIFK